MTALKAQRGVAGWFGGVSQTNCEKKEIISGDN